MAISPVDISMMQRLNDVAQIKHNENTKSDVMQITIANGQQKQINNSAQQVNAQSDTTQSDTRHDAREKGKNEYFSNGVKKKKKDVGKVVIKGQSTFDLKI